MNYCDITMDDPQRESNIKNRLDKISFLIILSISSTVHWGSWKIHNGCRGDIRHIHWNFRSRIQPQNQISSNPWAVKIQKLRTSLHQKTFRTTLAWDNIPSTSFPGSYNLQKFQSKIYRFHLRSTTGDSGLSGSRAFRYLFFPMYLFIFTDKNISFQQYVTRPHSDMTTYRLLLDFPPPFPPMGFLMGKVYTNGLNTTKWVKARKK